ncbi:DUF1638 family protein [Halalkaliarchaeum sp. AArc-CO]|uniref:DUF1638 domain-containing protein n=1 Tax=unclassified Halalkaliarchaeum TaxID=2678344 RepID=UPI00217E4D66|nr:MULTISPECIES: DUF1638 domain-containing protein [unclassified Halalkaliarchaeum]MDR5672057.1 DUF1638 domain-containing protein [Halalkaliarchaeum sp. AArc-GB]UWG51555.1 DUF1638 family protein [Halalkaliarchaeum sp. AArc-CO]
MSEHTEQNSLGIVACETLYAELEQIAPDATVRYVPQEYHEFPVNVPRNAEITELIDRYVRELEDAGVDRILLLYDADDEALSGIQTRQVPLFRSRAGDCVSVFLHGIEPLEFGERKASGTYYLTRGWIDRGLDAHKLYRGFLGEGEQLIEQFDRANAEPDELRISWPDTGGFERAVERGQGMSREAIGRFFHDVVGFYDRVVLTDTGTCLEFHREYAESFRTFVAELSAEHGDGHDVTLSIVDGDTSVLESLVDPDEDTEHLERHPPGTPL